MRLTEFSRSAAYLISFLMFSFYTNAKDGKDYIVRTGPVWAAQEKPKPGGPEAAALEFLELYKQRKFHLAKKMFAKTMSKKDRETWQFVDLKYDDNYNFGELVYWGIFDLKGDMPVVQICYKRTKGGGSINMRVPMTKVDGKWLVGAYK